MIEQTPNPRKSIPGTAAHLQAAADWWTQLRAAQPADDAHTRWLEWSCADPQHIDAFERVSELADQLAELDAPAREDLTREFNPAVAGSSTINSGGSKRRMRRGFALAAGFFVAAILIGAAARLWLSADQIHSERYVTGIAVDRDIDLADGSHVALGGASQLRTHFADDLRQVELDAGEAFFQIAHDTSRPFIVAAGDVSIRAVGTAFNVRRTGARVTIAVTEGRVRIASSDGAAMAKTSGADALEAVAGQQISYDPHASGLAVVSISPAQAMRWRDHRLEFLNEPLDVVVANINRYSLRPLIIADARLNALAFTGTVKPDALDSWLRALPKILPVRISNDAGQITLAAPEHSTH